MTVKKKVTVKVHGHKKTVTRKVKKTEPRDPSDANRFVAQNGAEIHQTTPITRHRLPEEGSAREGRQAQGQRGQEERKVIRCERHGMPACPSRARTSRPWARMLIPSRVCGVLAVLLDELELLDGDDDESRVHRRRWRSRPLVVAQVDDDGALVPAGHLPPSRPVDRLGEGDDVDFPDSLCLTRVTMVPPV